MNDKASYPDLVSMSDVLHVLDNWINTDDEGNGDLEWEEIDALRAARQKGGV